MGCACSCAEDRDETRAPPTPKLIAEIVCAGNQHGLRALIKSGADLNFAALFAVWSTQRDCLSMLIHSKANVNSSDRDGQTLLHWAAYRDDLDIIKILIENGACPDNINKEKNRPVDIAKSIGVKEYLTQEAMWQAEIFKMHVEMRQKQSTDEGTQSDGVELTVVMPETGCCPIVQRALSHAEKDEHAPMILDATDSKKDGSAHMSAYESVHERMQPLRPLLGNSWDWPLVKCERRQLAMFNLIRQSRIDGFQMAMQPVATPTATPTVTPTASPSKIPTTPPLAAPAATPTAMPNATPTDMQAAMLVNDSYTEIKNASRSEIHDYEGDNFRPRRHSATSCGSSGSIGSSGSGGSWEYPLSKQEKKDRVVMISMGMIDSLKEEVADLRMQA